MARSIPCHRQTSAAPWTSCARPAKLFSTTKTFSGLVLAPLEIAGVAIKARLKSLPGMQYKVGRDLLRRIKIAFDQNGVDTPTSAVKLFVPDKPLPPQT